MLAQPLVHTGGVERLSTSSVGHRRLSFESNWHTFLHCCEININIFFKVNTVHLKLKQQTLLSEFNLPVTTTLKTGYNSCLRGLVFLFPKAQFELLLKI